MRRRSSSAIALPILCLSLLPSTARGQCAGGGYATGQPCSSIDVGFQGCCEGGSTLKWCEGNQVCVKNCADNPSNHCCVPSTVPGCCDQAVMQLVCASDPLCCSQAWDTQCIVWASVVLGVLECAGGPLECESPVNLCGWDPTQSIYNCSSAHTGDPSGAFPLQCGGECVPSCVGLLCGSDGCGGSCGECPPASSCEDGKCVAGPCVANCGGGENGPYKFCGDDGCGGSCGACPPNLECNQGQCVEPGCIPTCDGKTCGDDGCGGSCGECDPWELCSEDGQCLPDFDGTTDDPGDDTASTGSDDGPTGDDGPGDDGPTAGESGSTGGVESTDASTGGGDEPTSVGEGESTSRRRTAGGCAASNNPHRGALPCLLLLLVLVGARRD